MTDTVGTVVVVDDDPDCRDLYEVWLEPEYDVATAADGSAALEQIDERVDVVVLDREMPTVRGEAVAAELDARDVDPFVVMVSGVEPDVDILDLPVDDYLAKPVGRGDVVDAVDGLVERTDATPRRRALLALRARKEALEARKRQSELRASEAYQAVRDRIERLRRGADGSADGDLAATDSAWDLSSTGDRDGSAGHSPSYSGQ